MRIEMKQQDLVELYQLLKVYEHTYYPEEKRSIVEWMEQVAEKYEVVSSGKDIRKESNPRSGGRKKKYSKEENEQILERKRSGESMRKIAQKMGCSVGHVQDVLGGYKKNR